MQLLGEEAGFDYLKALHKNVNQYTKSGSAPIKAAARGETTIGIVFLHDAVTQAVNGLPIRPVAPCEGTGYEIGSMSIIENARNMESAKKFYDWALGEASQALMPQAKAYQVPSNASVAPPPGSAGRERDQAHRLRLREVRVVCGAHAPAGQVGRRGEEPAPVVDHLSVSGAGRESTRPDRPPHAGN